ncbi:MAG: dihydroneopterin aldolase [Verrucomicrobiota bacterium]
MQDRIEIRKLKVETCIGVPDEERAHPQTLLVTVVMWPAQGFHGMADRISHTIDYAEVAARLTRLGNSRERKLIETFATDAAEILLAEYPLAAVEVCVEKHVLPETESVAVWVRRSR